MIPYNLPLPVYVTGHHRFLSFPTMPLTSARWIVTLAPAQRGPAHASPRWNSYCCDVNLRRCYLISHFLKSRPLQVAGTKHPPPIYGKRRDCQHQNHQLRCPRVADKHAQSNSSFVTASRLLLWPNRRREETAFHSVHLLARSP